MKFRIERHLRQELADAGVTIPLEIKTRPQVGKPELRIRIHGRGLGPTIFYTTMDYFHAEKPETYEQLRLLFEAVRGSNAAVVGYAKETI